MYGELTCYLGPMFAGKSTSLLQKVVWFKYIEEPTSVFKPSWDKRYSSVDIVTHNGYKIVSNVIEDPNEIFEKHNISESNHVFFDEIHFFHKDVINIIKKLLENNKDVYVTGLDCDFNGEPFYVSSLIAGMADNVYKIKSACNICGKPASKTFKKIKNEDNFEIGSFDIYEPRCNNHFKD